MVRRTRTLLIQAALAAAAMIPVAWPTLVGTEDPFVARLFRTLPLAGLGVLALLGLRINQTKVAIGAAAVAVAFLLVDGRALFGLPEGHLRERIFAVSVSLPLLLLALGKLEEQRLLSINTAVRAFVFILIPPFCARLAIHGLTEGPPIRPVLGFLHLPELMAVPTLLLIFATPFVGDPHLRAFQAGQATSMVVLCFAFDRALGTPSEDMLAVAFSASVTIEISAMLGVWWRKVYIDELTEVPNRRALNEYLRTLGERFTIAMVDIDFFKKLNDTYGHAEGDNVLRYVARHLADHTSGRVFRYGGEEFCLVYRGQQSDEVLETIDEMRERLAKRTFVVRAADPSKSKRPERASTKRDRGRNAGDKKKLSVTVSIGVASRTRQKSVEAVMEIADKMLYRAKDQGRNQVVAP